jgi:hypothetical protein
VRAKVKEASYPAFGVLRGVAPYMNPITVPWKAGRIAFFDLGMKLHLDA